MLTITSDWARSLGHMQVLLRVEPMTPGAQLEWRRAIASHHKHLMLCRWCATHWQAANDGGDLAA